ncbi:MAG TPA: hypothetical protein VGJ21_00440 [Terracidiphilus sp.]
MDANGNVFVADTFNNAVKEITAASGYTAVKTLGSGFNSPGGVAVDSIGNIFVADTANNAVKEILASGGYTTIHALGVGFNNPNGVAVDAGGNVFVADSGNNAIKEILAAGGYVTVQILGSGFSFPYGVAVDKSENVFVGDTSNFAVKEILAAGGYTTVNVLGSGFHLPHGVAVDATGNVFVADYFGAVKEILAAGGYTTVNTVGGTAFDKPSGVVVSAGNIFVADAGDNSVKQMMTTGGRFGPVNVGAAGQKPASLFFTFDTAGTLGSTAVVTQGVTGMDFTDAGSGTCIASTAYNAGDACTVVVNFGPKYPGLRYGAAELLNTAGNPLATGYVQGTGVGPLITFANSTSGAYMYSSKSTVDSGFITPVALAVNAAGAVFVADAGNHNTMSEFVPTASGGYTEVKSVITRLCALAGMALDGAGNVFVSGATNCFGANTYGVQEIAAENGYSNLKIVSTKFNNPQGLAVDGSGNIFVADYGNAAVKEILSAGGYTTVKTLGGGFTAPSAVAVDGSGNVFVADGVVKEILTAGGYKTVRTLGSGSLFVETLALDGSGNVFLFDSGLDKLQEISAASGYTTVNILDRGTNSYSRGLAVDETGNLFLAGDDGSPLVEKLDFVDPPSLSFSPTQVGSQSSTQKVTVTNNGTAALVVPVPGSGNNPNVTGTFALDPSTTCPDLNSGSILGELLAGASCDYAVDFVPVAPGAKSGSVTLTDNNRNVVGSNQVISVSGTGIKPPVGHLDGAADASAGGSAVPQLDNLAVNGWAADRFDGAPLANVKVYIDGTLAGTPTLRIARPDVAAAWNNRGFLDSGYRFLYPASSLALGNHAITVVAVDSAGLSTTFGPLNITVTPGPPFGHLDAAVDSVTGTSAVSRADSLRVQGWVADPGDGAPLSNVTVYVDGTSIGTPTLGMARNDVAALYGSRYRNSGFRLIYAASSLSVGTHKVTVVAVDSVGQATTVGPLSITVQ